MKPCLHRLFLLLPIVLSIPAGPVLAQPATVPLPQMDTDRCDYFSRLHRFAEESKSMCDEGRQVKIGPVTSQILEQCRTAQGARFDRLPIDDMIASFQKEVAAQGLGDACHSIKLQVWDLIQQ